jgi:hypothetical protein
VPLQKARYWAIHATWQKAWSYLGVAGARKARLSHGCKPCEEIIAWCFRFFIAPVAGL